MKRDLQKAYSHIRLSAPKQSEGKPIPRQLEAIRAFCEAHGLVLNEKLILPDLGVSAFHGDNSNK